MSEEIFDIANRFITDQICTRQELTRFKYWLSDPGMQTEVERWLFEHWSTSADVDSNAALETVFKQIQDYENGHSSNTGWSVKHIVKVYQKIAAVLLIPLIGFGLLFWLSKYEPSAEQFTESIIPRGQKSQIVLSDGTKVWINSDTKIKYPTNFNKKQRDIYLDGEAYFEVSKDKHKPFIVHASGLGIKVMGTKFNVKAYPDENEIETTLIEGNVSLLIPSNSPGPPAEMAIDAGQSFVYSKSDQKLAAISFNKEQIEGWKENRLIFENDKFSNLVMKLERWYNVEVIYDENKLQDRRLTVELYRDERLERLMEIIGLALSVDYKYENGKIILSPKNTNMMKK